jgi:hypothetical protein
LIFDAAVHDPGIAEPAPSVYGRSRRLRSADPKIGYLHVGTVSTVNPIPIKSNLTLASGAPANDIRYVVIPLWIAAELRDVPVRTTTESYTAIESIDIHAIGPCHILELDAIDLRLRRVCIYRKISDQTVTARVDYGYPAVSVHMRTPISW